MIATAPPPMTIDPSFFETLRDMRDILLDEELPNLADAPFDWLMLIMNNVAHNLQQCLAWPETCEMETAVLLTEAASFVDQSGQYQRWVPFAKTALARCPLTAAQQCELLLRLGAFYNRMGDWQTAVTHHQRAKALAETAQDPILLATAYFRLSTDYRAGDELEQGEAAGQTALQLAQDNHASNRLLAMIWNALGLVAWREGTIERLKKAEIRINKALALLESTDSLSLGKYLNNLGIVTHHQKNYEHARDYFDQAIDKLNSTNSELDKSRAYTSLGALYFDTKEWKKAEEAFRKAQSQITMQSGDLFLQGAVNQNLGNALVKQGKLEDVEFLLNRAMQNFQQINNTFWLGNTHAIMGELRNLQERLDESIECYQKAIMIVRPLEKSSKHAAQHLEDWNSTLARLLSKKEG